MARYFASVDRAAATKTDQRIGVLSFDQRLQFMHAAPWHVLPRAFEHCNAPCSLIHFLFPLWSSFPLLFLFSCISIDYSTPPSRIRHASECCIPGALISNPRLMVRTRSEKPWH